MTVIIFLIVLSVLVFAHEAGHFFVARGMGVKVHEFGFGFPPRLWGKKIKGTTYSINWIPVGGFVKLKGEAGEEAGDPDSFVSRPVWRKMAIVVAGVVMNFLLAAVLLAVGLMIGLPQQAEDLPAGAVARDVRVGIAQVLSGSPAEQAGIAAGDVVVSVDGVEFSSASDLQNYIKERSAGGPLLVRVERFGERQEFEVAPAVLSETGEPGLGVALFSMGLVSYPWYRAPVRAVELTVWLTGEIFKAFGRIIYSLATGGGVGVELAGPVGIAVLSGQAASLGLAYLLQFTAILSINLAIINILPFPALDGGRLLFLVIEGVRRRSVSRRLENMVHQIGFALLLALVIMVTYRDLIRFSDVIWSGLRNLF